MINRLLSIIYILMNKGTVTTGELAKRFEVSTRTIYRDIDTLSMAGIPVYATKGRGGGISLSKLGNFFKEKPENWVAIDFSDWSGRRKELFNQIRDAILNRRVLQFDYYGQYGEMSSRCVEPIQLLFKEYTWYVRAFCRTKQAMRLFKVLRMKRVVVLDEAFDLREPEEIGSISEDMQSMATGCPTGITQDLDHDESALIGNPVPEIILWIDKHEAYRIYDRFDEEEITVLPDGHFEVHYTCTLDDWVYGLILSFGPSAKVLGPEFVRAEVHRRITEMGRLYE